MIVGGRRAKARPCANSLAGCALARNQGRRRHRIAVFNPWYRAAGAGMGASLNTASATSAYILADRVSWLNYWQ